MVAEPVETTNSQNRYNFLKENKQSGFSAIMTAVHEVF